MERCRYNTFYVLYPLGICSEMWLIYIAIEPAKRWRIQYEYLLKMILVLYIPGLIPFHSSGAICNVADDTQALIFCTRT